MRARLLLFVLLLGCGSRSVTVEPRPEEDAGDTTPPPAEVDVTGTWHDCTTTIIYGADGTTTAINHREGGCTARGTYVVEGDLVTTTWTEPGCGFGPESTGHRAVVGERGLASINPSNGRVNLRANGALTPHRIFRITGTEPGLPAMSSILSVVGDPTDQYSSGCYWSEDGMCGGLFSCSGTVVQWRFEEDGRFVGSVSCQGGCPCGAVLQGSGDEEGPITGTYLGSNCDRQYEGSFTATPL